jgi:putative membrane protein
VRLDRRSIPYRVLENGLRLGGLLVFGLVSSGSAGSPLAAVGTGAAFVLLGLVLVLGWEVARYRRYSYELTPDTFDIRSGIFSRREREIPYERIQNVDIAQNVLQRALSIAEVRIETAGGSGSEAHLRYVDRTEADRLQDEVSRRKGEAAGADGTAAEPRERERLFALSDREHVVLGLVSADLRLLGLLSVALSAFAPQLARQLAPQFDIVSLFGPALALAGIVAFWFVSGALQVLRYYGFTLTRGTGELRYERGLLQRYTGTIPLSKVQALTLRENVLARAVGYASLSIQTAGRGGGGDGDGSNVESAVPIAARDRAIGLAREIQPFGEVEFERPPKRARTRYAVRYALALAGVTGLLWVVRTVTGLFGLWYLPLAGLVAVPVAAHLAWTHKGYYLGEEHVVTRNGFWRRRTMIVPYDRVQTVFDSQTLFQRRRRLGTVTVDTAGGGGLGSGDAVVVDVDADTARELREQVAGRLQRALAAGATPATRPQ